MDTLIHDFEVSLRHLDEVRSWLQLLVLAAAAAVAYTARSQLNHFIKKYPEEGLRLLALRSAQRVIFPLTALVGVIAGRAVLQALEVPVEILHVAVPMMLSFAGVRLSVFLLRKTFVPSPVLKAWENLIALSSWTVVVLYLFGWLPHVLGALDAIGFSFGTVRVSLLSTAKMVLTAVVLLTLALWVSGVLERQINQAQHISPGVRAGLAKFVSFFVVAVAVLGGVDAMGIDLTTLTVFGGALGVGLGFGLQRIASNFISGFILVLDRSIRPGDVISLGKNFGWVQELRARYVVVRNRDGVDTLIPNESLITSEVVNWSYGDRKVRLHIPVSVSYRDDPEQAMQIMELVAHNCDRVLKDPPPACRFLEFGDSGLMLELRVWIDDPEEGVGFIKSTLNLEIWKAFRGAGITFPYPQRDLYIKELPTPWSERSEPSDDSAVA